LKIRSSPVKALAQQHYLRLLQPENLEAPEFIGELQEINPDLCLVVAFRILPPAVIGIPELGCINLHASLLPELRGAAPINWALMQGLTRTGITAFLIERRVDTGGILLQREIEILPEDDHGSLADRMAILSGELSIETIDAYAAGLLIPKPQQGTPTRAPKITPELCAINWSRSAETIHNQVRGLSPDPGAFTVINDKRVKVFRTAVVKLAQRIHPGAIIESGKQELIVAAGEDGVRLLELQLEGRRRMTAEELLRGWRPVTGTILTSGAFHS
jgi:methionyl-tRNA formyltransferase